MWADGLSSKAVPLFIGEFVRNIALLPQSVKTLLADNRWWLRWPYLCRPIDDQRGKIGSDLIFAFSFLIASEGSAEENKVLSLRGLTRLQPRQRSTPAGLSAFSLVFFHVRSQQGIDSSLIAWSLFPVPVKHIAIDA